MPTLNTDMFSERKIPSWPAQTVRKLNLADARNRSNQRIQLIMTGHTPDQADQIVDLRRQKSQGRFK